MAISMDMKYTALYWALRFVENELDVHVKDYIGYKIIIDAEKQMVNYGDKIKVLGEELNFLKRHKDFVVLECIDRLLLKGYKPTDIVLDGRENCPDIVLNGNVEIYCEQWGKDYLSAAKIFNSDKNNSILYTSRLVSGLLEYKNIIKVDNDAYNYGLFEPSVPLYSIIPQKAKEVIIEQTADIDDYENFEDELITYKCKSKVLKVPEGITTIGASAFWNNTFVEEIILPKSLKRLGGDCFYYCTSLKKVNIPSEVWIMGNNPFAGCPFLEIINESPYFVLENGVLYNQDKTNLIHYTISKTDKEFIVPNGVTCLGKHCFFACDNLERIIVPESVIRFENNPFSGCTKLSVDNKSSYYYFENGVIYNKFKTTIIGCLNGSQIDRLVIPETVTLISRNSFWNCKGVKNIVITKNVDRIGYNPFAGAENLLLESESPLFIAENGIIYDQNKTHMLCATNRAVGKTFNVPDSVTHINRGVFSGCKDLEQINFNGVTYIDKSSFTNCTSLKEVYIPDSVTYIGEWVFSYCKNLNKISINKNTFVDKNAFNECPAEIIWRD